MDGSGDVYLITFIGKEKKCKRKRGDRRTDEVRASEVGRLRTITSRVVFACSIKKKRSETNNHDAIAPCRHRHGHHGR